MHSDFETSHFAKLNNIVEIQQKNCIISPKRAKKEVFSFMFRVFGLKLGKAVETKNLKLSKTVLHTGATE